MTAIPAWVITGPLGSGKTTAIARLLAGKPADEDWVVLLNEYSDAGIDALTVAAAARGIFDVRLVPGGCLCCVGEKDFRRSLQELIDERRPQRILVEPSGLGHPAGVVDELLGHEARGALRLEAVVGLLDPARLDEAIAAPDSLPRAIADIADSLVLSKADLASAAQARSFASFAGELFPRKRWSGPMRAGELPPEALDGRVAAENRAAAGVGRPAIHAQDAHHAHDAHHAAPEQDTAACAAGGRRRVFRQLGHVGASWVFPRRAGFVDDALLAVLRAARGDPRLRRLKLVARVSDDEWILAQLAAGRIEQVPSAWRRDSRIELVLEGEAPVDWASWDAAWAGCLMPGVEP